ncbi:ferroptosis suppressor protein 1 [Protopterus annectens]|uniref:ferroptosis suppressor protein 1 n=1 Tax=Protopterus annectens TaxID=7888 RepID=UPI001CFA28F0|nr:ferroptosis suppressor protein 1 [Protopterus annectens]
MFFSLETWIFVIPVLILIYIFRMGSGASVDSNVHVLIVGGGFGGMAAANQLKSKGIPFTLVDMRDAFHHNCAALRASVEKGFAQKTFIPFSVTYGEKFKQGKVLQIKPESQTVTLEGGEDIHYTHLIIATGSQGPFPGKFNETVSREEAIQAYEDMVKEVQKAEKVIVVGGGSAGVEMAAEVKTDYPDKEVTIIHSHEDLSDAEMQPRVRSAIKDILLNKGVHLLLGHKVTNLNQLALNKTQENVTVVTDKGQEVTANLVICCTGIKINSDAYRNAFHDKLATDGALKVNDYLQVEGFSNIYAIGDCANVKEPKMAYHAGLHAKIAVDNIVKSLTGTTLKPYKTGTVKLLFYFLKFDNWISELADRPFSHTTIQ